MTLTTIKKRKKQKVWLFPTAIEREYVKYLRGVAKQIIETAKQKLPGIEPHFKEQLRQDAFTDILEQWLAELLQATNFFTNENEIAPFVQNYLNQVAGFNKKQFHKVLKSAYSVDIFVSEPWLDEALKLAEWQNINLIKSIPQQFHEKLRYRMVEAVRKGESYQSLADDLEKLFDTPQRRAMLIARDQIGKLNGRLTQLRQENIGVKSYIWRGVLDERERLNHVEREGEEFRWDTPPDDGHPGEPILCRCSAEAVLPEFDELVNQGNVVAVTNLNNEEKSVKDVIIQTSLTEKSQINMRSEWDDNFPDTIIDRKLGEATSHPLYEKAKSGSVEDAYNLAKDLVSDDAISKLDKMIQGKDVILVPVHAEESAGRNMIPIAVATVIAKRLNIPVDLSIVQSTKVSRTGSDGWHRLIHTPKFSGDVPKKLAIILDDTQTQGGTLASLKGYIETNNGKVLGSYALTGKQYSVQLRLSRDTLSKLRSKYGKIEKWWIQEFGYDFSKLTEWEARFILNSRKTPDEVRNTILTRK
ncbi:phage minor head protein [Gallibacterium salpingitidis]|uniref:phage head morphogenesis protein n=1 Tax=Gallibacterium salpingitidis TaxID=505341 RepID=UPI0009EDB6B3|nr:phage minor head protein [Gallibacterium salpingitidis]